MSVELNHRINGPDDAPVLVLSNSLGASLDMWASQVPALSAAFRVLRYDSRGHGASSVPPGPYDIADLGHDVLHLLDLNGIEHAHFCGLSLGGATGMWLAANAPERIDRLALLCTSARFGTPEMWSERAAQVREHGTESVADAGLERWFTEQFRVAQPALAARFRAMIAGQPDDGYAELCGVLERLDLRSDLAEISTPTFVIAGAQDPATPPDPDARLIAGAIKGSRLEILDPAAHLANVERADEVTDLILDHLQGDAA